MQLEGALIILGERRESKAWHPDKHGGSPDGLARAAALFKRLNAAHQLLADPARRAWASSASHTIAPSN